MVLRESGGLQPPSQPPGSYAYALMARACY